MRRRDLFGRLAALAAAVTLAPAAKAEAASGATIIETPDIGVPVDAALYVHGKTVLEGDLIVNGVSITDTIADAYAEGYERGRAIRDSFHESRQLRVMRA